MALDANTLKPFVEPVRASRKWNTRPPRTVNDEIFFIRRSASYCARPPAREQEAEQPKVEARIESALETVDTYIDGKIKSSTAPGPLGGSSGAPAPALLPLSDRLPMALGARERPRKAV
jgi:hypothetical protein